MNGVPFQGAQEHRTSAGYEKVEPLHQSTDATRWARTFIDTAQRNYSLVESARLYVDENALVSYFANAIEAGRTAGVLSAQRLHAAKAAAAVPQPYNGIIIRENGRDTVLSPESSAAAVMITAFIDVLKELYAAQGSNAVFHSAHEGWAVIYEELVKELGDEVFRNPLKLGRTKIDRHSPMGQRRLADHRRNMRNEAMQVAAMAIRFMVDVTPEAR